MQNNFLQQYVLANYARNVHKNVSQSLCPKYPLLFCNFNENWICQISQKTPNMRFHEIQFGCLEHTKNNYSDKGNKM